jgi:hypothetical protein
VINVEEGTPLPGGGRPYDDRTTTRHTGGTDSRAKRAMLAGIPEALRRHPVAILAWAVAVALALSALLGARAASDATAPRTKTSQFVRRSELGMDAGALNEAANAAIRADLRRVGLDIVKSTIYRTSIDGDRGTVTAIVAYGRRDGSQIRQQSLTLIFHRSLWSLGQITPGGGPNAN